VIVVDTSVWVEFFRRRDHPVVGTLKAHIGRGAELATTEAVLMEVFAGAASAEDLARIRSQLVALPILRLEGLADFEEAALIYRTCRAAGQAIRSHVDCLIAVPVSRHGASLLHNDSDFETIARYRPLKLEGSR